MGCGQLRSSSSNALIDRSRGAAPHGRRLRHCTRSVEKSVDVRRKDSLLRGQRRPRLMEEEMWHAAMSRLPSVATRKEGMRSQHAIVAFWSTSTTSVVSSFGQRSKEHKGRIHEVPSVISPSAPVYFKCVCCMLCVPLLIFFQLRCWLIADPPPSEKRKNLEQRTKAAEAPDSVLVRAPTAHVSG